jgi:hypothetical protein
MTNLDTLKDRLGVTAADLPNLLCDSFVDDTHRRDSVVDHIVAGERHDLKVPSQGHYMVYGSAID